MIDMIIKVGTVFRKTHKGLYVSDIHSLKHPDLNLPNEMRVDRDFFDAFVDYIDGEYPGFYNYLYFNYENSEKRIRMINDIDFENEVCAVLTEEDRDYFNDVYEHFTKIINELPDEKVVSIHPRLRPKYDMLKILTWLHAWINYSVMLCLHPGILSYPMYPENEDDE